MIVRRRDNKGRVLRTGEFQMADGRYRYKYRDAWGKQRVLYSTRLDVKDPYVPGKKKDISLREKEQKVVADKFDQIVPEGGGYTVLSLVERYISLKRNVRPTTKQGYKTVVNILAKNPFGAKRIDKVKMTDAKLFLLDLNSSGKGFSTVRTVRGVLRPAFQTAVDDDMIRKNPFGFELASIIVIDSIRREAVSHDVERRFLDFIKNDNHFGQYYDLIYILFNTGLRVSELCGLTVRDIDFITGTINVDHQLQYYNGKGLHIVPPKTEAGIRKVPMSPEVVKCFQRSIANRKKLRVEPMIDGYSGFIFIDERSRGPIRAYKVEKIFQHSVEKHNATYKKELPTITPHICRHTFCSRMASKHMNPKVLQTIMGHSEIEVTMNVYTHVSDEDVANEHKRVLNSAIV